jgi:hypothetical protein
MLATTSRWPSSSATVLRQATLSQLVSLLSQKRGILRADATPLLIWRRILSVAGAESVARGWATSASPGVPAPYVSPGAEPAASRRRPAGMTDLHSVQRMPAACGRAAHLRCIHLNTPGLGDRSWLPHSHWRGVQAILRAAPERDMAVRVPAVQVADPFAGARVRRVGACGGRVPGAPASHSRHRGIVHERHQLVSRIRQRTRQRQYHCPHSAHVDLRPRRSAIAAFSSAAQILQSVIQPSQHLSCPKLQSPLRVSSIALAIYLSPLS